jgi:EF-hand domain pair
MQKSLCFIRHGRYGKKLFTACMRACLEMPGPCAKVVDLCCEDIFIGFSCVGSGTIDTRELSATLRTLGQVATDEDISLILSQVDEDNSGTIEFNEFLKVVERQKVSGAAAKHENSTLEAFVAMGGNVGPPANQIGK